MAKIVKSGFGPEFYGRIGNIVVVRGRYGNYVKPYVKQHNPQTTEQMRVRTEFSRIQQMWRSLSYQQITAWNERAMVWAIRNKKGKGYMTGRQMFLQMNLNLIHAGSIPIPECPDYLEKPMELTYVKTEIVSKHGAEDLMLTFKPKLDDFNVIIVSATPTMKGRSCPDKKSFRMIGVIDKLWNPGNKAKSILRMWEERFHSSIDRNSSIGFKFQVMETVTGQAGNAVYCMAISND